MSELRLDIAWLGIFQVVGSAGAPQRLIREIRDPDFLRERLEVELQVVPDSEGNPSLAWKKQIGYATGGPRVVRPCLPTRRIQMSSSS